jgi:uncharacterized membrane protein
MLNKTIVIKFFTALMIVFCFLPTPSFAAVSAKNPLRTVAVPVAQSDTSTDTIAPMSSGKNDSYYIAKVLKILDQGVDNSGDTPQPWQTLKIQITGGDKKGQQITLDNGKDFVGGTFHKYAVGDKVIVDNPPNEPGAKQNFYYIIDWYRIPNLIIATLFFFALAIYFGRKRGLTSIIGMVFSVLVIFYYIMPTILKGGDPFLTAITGAVIIIILSLYLSHGFNRRTTIALISTLLTLGLAVVLDLIFVHFTKLVGDGTEDAIYLQLYNAKINLQGVLLGGIIIGVLGVLDDVTTGQSAAIEEIHTANNDLGFKELFKKGLSVGQEHIASLINTLVLAYVGASFPLFLLYSVQQQFPNWVTLNYSFGEEIIRTLVGSSVLVIAVPLTTTLAALYYSRRKIRGGKL